MSVYEWVYRYLGEKERQALIRRLPHHLRPKDN